MTRIKSNNVQFEGSFVVPIEQSSHNKKLEEALKKEQEILQRAEQAAQQLTQEATQQAEKIIEDATQEAQSQVEEITQTAYKEGFEAGRQEGLENITQELEHLVLSINDFAKSNFEIKENIIKSAYLDIISLVIEIARKVCSKSLELDETLIKEVTEKAIQSLKDKENITIIVNPQMAEKIYSISEELKEKIPQLSSIKIVEDQSVSPDGTIVESPLSRVDCRIQSQINEIADKLMCKLDSTPNQEFSQE